MKIDVITRHSVPNYGSLLQSYATQEAIKKLGHESEIVNYTRYDERYSNLASTLIKGKKWDKNPILRIIYKIIQTPNYKKMYKTFEKYRKNFLTETEREYGNIDELKNNPPKADIYCSGSDQIWGKIGNDTYDEAYFLEFAKGHKCISYAASFGKTELDSELDKNLERLISKYKALLVRENTAKDIILNKGIRNVEQVLDPTFLLDKEEWSSLADKSNKNTSDEYILVYQLHDNKDFEKYAKAFSKNKKIKLIRISPAINQITRPGKLIYLPTQFDFLKYFRDAKYILTDSFHATVFSILFNKQFMDILPQNKTGTRIESVLKLFDIDDRLLKSYNDFASIDKKIDYEIVNDKIEEERNKSLKLFKEVIEN